jgi:hypothetical protein
MFVWVLAGGRIFVTSIVDSAILYIAAILNLFNLRSARMLFRHTVLDF